MVRQQRRTDRCFLPAASNSVAQVRFPVGTVHRRQPPPHQVSGKRWAGSETGSADSRQYCSSLTTTEEERGDDRGDLVPEGSRESKRPRLDRPEDSVFLILESCGPPQNESCSAGADAGPSRVPLPEQQGAAEHSEDSRAAELQSVGSLKVTIQRSSESREFGQTDRTADRQTGGLHCHVCNLTCHTLQVFHEHMSGAEHVKKLQEITHSICLNTHTQQDRGRRPNPERWCDNCQTHFSGDVIVHRQTKQHKMCKQLCRPFCPVCKRHFRTPRKFVEHMKSQEHKQQVRLQEVQEEELITVDAVGCFKGEDEEEEEEEEEEVEVADDEEEEEDVGKEATEEGVLKTAHTEEYDPDTTCGSRFVVPVSGFLCRLCNKFFHREITAKQTHCRTRTHFLNLQSHRAQRRNLASGGGTRREENHEEEEEDTPAPT